MLSFHAVKSYGILLIQKINGFRWSGWEGWIITSIQSFCFQFHSIHLDRKSPFKKLSAQFTICNKTNKFIPDELNHSTNDNGKSFYKFDIRCFKKLFNTNDYSPSIEIIPSITKTQSISSLDTKVIIVVGDSPPLKGNELIHRNDYELRIICIIKADRRGGKVSHFDAIRCMRHGKGFNSWWKQERNESIVTQCIHNEDILPSLFTNNECFFLQYISVYVRVENDCNNHWRSKFFESMSGKIHVKCQCCNFPLIPSNIQRSKKRKCNLKHYISSDGTFHIIVSKCKRLESYVCSNIQCITRICKKCYNLFPNDTTTTIVSSNDHVKKINHNIHLKKTFTKVLIKMRDHVQIQIVNLIAMTMFL